MISPKLIALDMDGTLLGPDGGVSDRNLQALRHAEDAGIEIVIATGRRHSYALRVLRELGLTHTSALVSSNGTVVRTLGSELVHCRYMDTSTAQWLCQHVAEFRSTLVLTFDTVSPDGDDARGALVVEELEDLHASIGRWMEVNAPYIAHVRPLEQALEAGRPIQMMLCGTMARMRKAEELLLAHPRVAPMGATAVSPDTEVTLHRTVYPERDLCILDILPAGVSKASALQHLAELRGLTMADVLAIGDNWNDVPMFELAGDAVLMGNAPEDLKQLARERHWTIGPSNAEDGVAVCIEDVLAHPAEHVAKTVAEPVAP